MKKRFCLCEDWAAYSYALFSNEYVALLSWGERCRDGTQCSCETLRRECLDRFSNRDAMRDICCVATELKAIIHAYFVFVSQNTRPCGSRSSYVNTHVQLLNALEIHRARRQFETRMSSQALANRNTPAGRPIKVGTWICLFLVASE